MIFVFEKFRAALKLQRGEHVYDVEIAHTHPLPLPLAGPQDIHCVVRQVFAETRDGWWVIEAENHYHPDSKMRYQKSVKTLFARLVGCHDSTQQDLLDERVWWGSSPYLSHLSWRGHTATTAR